MIAVGIRAEVSRLVSQMREDLIRVGFAAVSATEFQGTIEWSDVDSHLRKTEVIVSLPDAFPFTCPRVKPAEIPGPSWHLDQDNAMCLWSAFEETGGLPWSDADALIGRAAHWLQKCADGWTHEPLDLDLERYLPPTPGLFVYETEQIAVGYGLRLTKRTPRRRG